MILFVTLLMIISILTVVTVLAISIGGSMFIVLFGDVIVCIFIIMWIMKKLLFRKKK